jgi:hypothetical protein
MIFPNTELGTLVSESWNTFQNSVDVPETLELLDKVQIRDRLDSILRSCVYRKASDKRDMM